MLAPSQHALYMRARRAAETPNQRALRLRRRRYYAKRRRARIVPTDLRLKWKREWEELVARVQPLWTSTAVARENITQTPAPVTRSPQNGACVPSCLPSRRVSRRRPHTRDTRTFSLNGACVPSCLPSRRVPRRRPHTRDTRTFSLNARSSAFALPSPCHRRNSHSRRNPRSDGEWRSATSSRCPSPHSLPLRQ